jgi:hypothetical protein
MGKTGYICVIINQSLPNCVKFGKTTKNPPNQDFELLMESGISTPNIFIYESYFSDCDEAESYICTLLKSRGFSSLQNREFFLVSSTDAINAIFEAKEKFGSKINEVTTFKDKMLSELSHEENENKKLLINKIVNEAVSYKYGAGDYIEDKNKAISLYKEAAKLGSADAYIQLADLVANFKGDVKQGLDWLMRGADNGFYECWLELAKAFVGKNTAIIIPNNNENARKCYRRYFESINFSRLGFDEDRLMFFSFIAYLELIGKIPEQRDIEVSKMFVRKFLNFLLELKDKNDAKAKHIQFRQIIEKYSSWLTVD